MESRLSKANVEFGNSIWALYSHLGNSITCIGMFWKVAFLETSRNSLLTEGLQSTDCNATKGHFRPNFLEMFWKFQKISRKNSAIELLLSKLEAAEKIKTPAKLVLKILQNSWDNICCEVPFYWRKG